MENDENTVIGRRKFLNKLMLGGIALAGASSLFIAVGFLYLVSVKKPDPRYICLVDQIPPDKPLEIEDPFGRKVLLMRRDDGELMAISTICSHLGCMVFYKPQKKVLNAHVIRVFSIMMESRFQDHLRNHSKDIQFRFVTEWYLFSSLKGSPHERTQTTKMAKGNSYRSGETL